MAGLVKRGDTYHLRMRVPRRYASVMPGKHEIQRSLRTSDEKLARAQLLVTEQHILAELDLLLAGRSSPGSREHFEAASGLAASRGFVYRTADELATGPLEDVLTRFASLKSSKDDPASEATSALLGTVERPRLTITEVAESMEKRFPEDVKYKNDRQKSVWRSRWTRPAAKIVELLGLDPVFTEIHRVNQALPFRDALRDRIIEGDMLGRSAQKEIQLLNLMWGKFHESLGIDERDMPFSPFAGLGKGFSKLDEEEGRKLQVPLEIIAEKIVPEGALDFMNPQARDITLVLTETGARQSEITDLPPGSIFLDAQVPHIWIRRETGIWAREIKNKQSKRKIPLVGVALEAMRRNPEGFSQYRHKGTYSATANKALHAHGLLPEEVTIGGLRHSFEARLKAALIENDDRAELMGHSVKKARGREVYGDEMELRNKLELHRRIMFTPRRA
ncbi:DUF6538 domain-containing protein [Sagittula stellata]|uniref:Phage integrase n=1 Tax=Sagittula stellata (strain ATCC 700073 / DSM 11524 / E-37) TaxID=388399 RepID=A3K8F5_SAGS3|nr:DUF6538 domain-containing protein [Sagittula stellata]EBA06634.1 phage integrase [Sagittula stellata E-37]